MRKMDSRKRKSAEYQAEYRKRRRLRHAEQVDNWMREEVEAAAEGHDSIGQDIADMEELRDSENDTFANLPGDLDESSPLVMEDIAANLHDETPPLGLVEEEEDVHVPSSLETPPPLLHDEDFQEMEAQSDQSNAVNAAPEEDAGGGDADPNSWLYNSENLQNGDDKAFRLELGTFMAKMTAAGKCSKKAANEMLQYFALNSEQIVRMKRRRSAVRSLDWLLQRTYEKLSPRFTTDVYNIDQDTRLQTCIGSVSVMPKELEDRNPVKRTSRIALLDVFKHVYKLHNVNCENPPEEWRVIDFASDGVTFTNYGSWKSHVACISFAKCGKPMPYQIHQLNASEGGKLTPQQLLGPFVEELQNLPFPVELRWTIGDSKERKFTKGMTTVNAKYACEFCLMRGGHLPGDNRGTRVSYPPQENPSPARTTESCRRAMFRRHMVYIAQGSREDFKWGKRMGVTSFSPLLLIRGFDMVRKGPLDAMHLLALGICKEIFFRTLGPDSNRELEAAFNDIIKIVRIPTELGRRTRAFSRKYKASEYRLLGMFVFPWLVLCGLCNSLPDCEKQVILLFTYVYRALYLDNDKFANLRESVDLQGLLSRMANLYTLAFGAAEHTFNEHQFFSHLLQTRIEMGPLYNYAMWKYEDTFAKMKRSFHAGTRHEGKQIVQRMYAYDSLNHRCQHNSKKILYCAKRSSKRDDSILCTREGFFRIKRKSEEGYICRKIATARLQIDCLPELDWDLVLAKRFAGEEEACRLIRREEITGKGINVGDTIMECPKEWLLE